MGILARRRRKFLRYGEGSKGGINGFWGYFFTRKLIPPMFFDHRKLIPPVKLIPPRFSEEKLITPLKGGGINFNPTV